MSLLSRTISGVTIAAATLSAGPQHDRPRKEEPADALTASLPRVFLPRLDEWQPVGYQSPRSEEPPRAVVVEDAPRRYEVVSTDHFVVRAQTKDLAERFAKLLERRRDDIAIKLLGDKLPETDMKVTVIIAVNGTDATRRGKSDLRFHGGELVEASTEMEARAEDLVNLLIPHEVTHLVLAAHYGEKVPRWADEGAAVMNESVESRIDHQKRCIRLLNEGEATKLSALFEVTKYPKKINEFYCQAYSVANFLVHDRKEGASGFIKFVQLGLSDGWGRAAKKVYGFESIDKLEDAWIDSLRHSSRPKE